VTISNRDLTGENDWRCVPLHAVVDVEKAVYYAVRILRSLETVP